ncbi:MAG: IgGFc-binding protein [Labilithrix sp.]|nr:IgGFc-binding protein [Labilithrix sp.]
MRDLWPLFGIGALLSGAALVSGACGSGRSEFAERPKPPELGASDDAGEPGCKPQLRCSGDLKRVLRVECDGTEAVEQVCGPDFGCGEGACVEACKSAELSKGSIGCAFATLPPDSTIANGNGSCFATTIANVWDRPVSVRATLGGEPIDVSGSIYYAEQKDALVQYERVDGPIAPGRVAIVFLAKAETRGAVACPPAVTPALTDDPISHGTGRTRAFLLTTDAPVSAYSIWPYGGTGGQFPAATLLLPTTAWDTRYIAVNPWTTGNNSSSSSNLGWPFLQIVAAEDDTEVTIRPNVNIAAGRDVEAVPRGTASTWKLRAGEVLQIKQKDDPSGSPIESNKAVALFGGSECTMMLRGHQACDVTGQQTPAVTQWGSEYALVPYRPRNDFGVRMTKAREAVPWRLVGAADGTKLTYDPIRPGSAPETLEAGEVATFTTSDVTSIRSQDAEHPFHATMHMTGQTAVPGALGDPDFVNVVPTEQFLNRYIFFADYTYMDTTLTLVRKRTATGFKPVTLECAGELTGWEPLDKSGTYEFVWVYLTKRKVPVDHPGGKCGDGRHEAHSDGPFSVHVWGMGSYASYGYAAGQGSRSLHDVKGPPVK